MYTIAKKYPWLIIILLFIGLLIHFLGCYLYINETRLYDIDHNFLMFYFKFDNFVHLYNCTITFLIVDYLYEIFIISKSKVFKVVSCILITLGLSTFIEIIELIAVLFFDAQKEVGDYINNAFDLVYNLYGSLIGCTILVFYKNK
jgi:hypothetical protein